MLRLMEANPNFPPEVREALEKLRLVDDVVSALAGDGNEADLGSFTLRPGRPGAQGQAVRAGDRRQNQARPTNVVDKCGPCKQAVDVPRFREQDDAGRRRLPVRCSRAARSGDACRAVPRPPRRADHVHTDKIGYKDTLNIPIAWFFIFSVAPVGLIEASLHLKGGVDTKASPTPWSRETRPTSSTASI